MENHVKKLCHRLPMFLVGLVVWSSLFVSCKDEYRYDDSEPDWLGESIYEYLVTDGSYKNFVKIIDDLEYSEVLRKTGSKTLFVADDAAFERFYQGNPWGVTRYEDLSDAQKKLILNFSVINNAYLIETLSNYYNGSTLEEGSAMRRTTTVSLLDSVPYVKDDKLPTSKQWVKYHNDNRDGMYLMQDASGWPMVHLLQKVLDYNGITNADFKVMTGIARQRNDAHIFKYKVLDGKRDIACKNGYINVIDDVLVPPTNMASYIRSVPQFSQFSRMLDRFCAPYYDPTNTNKYREYLYERGKDFSNDSIYELCYYSKIGGRTSYPNGSSVETALLLAFDPGYNSYTYQYGNLQSDMGAIFAPTNEALTEYFEAGQGRALRERYGSWDNVPDDILALLINRHMRESLVNSVPSVFYKMVDNTSSLLRTKAEDIVDSLNYVGLNGIVYATSKIYPPDDYISVYGPVLFSNKTSIMKSSIKKYLYHLYLNSMVNKYAFVAPTDTALKFYIDPLTYGTAKPTVLKFWYDDRPSVQKVKATIYNYNKLTNQILDSVTIVDNDAFIKSRMVNILDQSIVVKDFKTGGSFKDGYYFTKDGNVILASKIEDIPGKVTSSETVFQGGQDIKTDRVVHVRDSGIYHQENGTTYLVDELVQTPFRSVYSVLSDSANYPEFQEFFKLLSEFPKNNVFLRKKNYFGIDFNVKFFNTYRYTVYVPTNQAILDAYENGTIMKWEDINNISDQQVKDSVINRLERFVRYHFQDNSVFVHPNQSFEGLYQTATIKKDSSSSFFDTYINKFYRIKVENSVDSQNNKTLKLTSDLLGNSPYSVNVVVNDPKYYNIMTRDFVFSLDPDGLSDLTSSSYLSSEITTSSTAVIHQIDRVLRFE